MRMRSHQLSSPRESRERNSPVPSTWPCTMWPFIRPLGESGRSRLTREPGRRSPRLLRSSVSGARSAENESGRSSATVRQTPLTAMLAPRAASERTVEQRMERRDPAVAPVVTTAPSSSIIPVNIKVSFDGEFVGWNGMDGDVVDENGVGAAAPSDAAGEGERFHAAQNLGAVVEENAIHHAVFQRAPVEFAAGLDHEREIALAAQPIDDAATVGAPAGPLEHEHLDAARFEQHAPFGGGRAGGDDEDIASRAAARSCASSWIPCCACRWIRKSCAARTAGAVAEQAVV